MVSAHNMMCVYWLRQQTYSIQPRPFHNFLPFSRSARSFILTECAFCDLRIFIQLTSLGTISDLIYTFQSVGLYIT